MATGVLYPTWAADGYRKRPIDSYAKLRELYFKIVNGAVALDATSTVELGELPPGAVRVFPHLGKLVSSAFGASRVLKIGHHAYRSSPSANPVGTPDIAEDDDAFSTGLDISANAAIANAWGPALTVKYDFYSTGGIKLFGTVTGGTIPAAATLEGVLLYAVE